MNKSVFLNLVLQQQPISEPDTEALEALAESFPYCQTAHLLLAKAAYDRGSMLSNQKLRRAAAYATNRQLLKKLIYTTTATVTLHPLQPQAAPAETELPATEIAGVPSASALSEISEQVADEKVIEDSTLRQPAEQTPEPVISEAEETRPEPITDEIPLTAAEAAYPPVPLPEEPETGAAEPEEIITGDMPLTAAEASALAEINCLEETTETETAPPDPESLDEELARLLVIDHILNDPDLFGPEKTSPAPETVGPEPGAAEPDTGTAATEPEEETSPETLSDFDHYLFRPEREKPAEAPEENLQVSYPGEETEQIFRQDTLGYWMNSSRLGECLQLKDDWTTHQQPYDFHPELLLEYHKEHPLTKTLEPSDSILSRQLDIIDQFLKQNPRLKTIANTKNLRTEPLEDLSLKSTKIKKDMASENLAHIFVQQGKIKKAIKIYEHLILKIPEKKPYFVAQIEKLQNSL